MKNDQPKDWGVLRNERMACSTLLSLKNIKWALPSLRIWKQVLVTNIIQYEWGPPEGNKNDKDKVLHLNINC